MEHARGRKRTPCASHGQPVHRRIPVPSSPSQCAPYSPSVTIVNPLFHVKHRGQKPYAPLHPYTATQADGGNEQPTAYPYHGSIISAQKPVRTNVKQHVTSNQPDTDRCTPQHMSIDISNQSSDCTDTGMTDDDVSRETQPYEMQKLPPPYTIQEETSHNGSTVMNKPFSLKAQIALPAHQTPQRLRHNNRPPGNKLTQQGNT